MKAQACRELVWVDWRFQAENVLFGTLQRFELRVQAGDFADKVVRCLGEVLQRLVGKNLTIVLGRQLGKPDQCVVVENIGRASWGQRLRYLTVDFRIVHNLKHCMSGHIAQALSTLNADQHTEGRPDWLVTCFSKQYAAQKTKLRCDCSSWLNLAEGLA